MTRPPLRRDPNPEPRWLRPLISLGLVFAFGAAVTLLAMLALRLNPTMGMN